MKLPDDLMIIDPHIHQWDPFTTPREVSMPAKVVRRVPPLGRVITALANRLRQGFILLSPTSDNLDACSQELLARDGAGFFALDAQVVLRENGSLVARRPTIPVRFLYETWKCRRFTKHSNAMGATSRKPPRNWALA